MIDLFHIPNNLNHQVFFTIGDRDTWQTWTKPRNAKFIFMTAIGGGGGGGGNRINNIFGGAGGGSSSISKLMVPANLIPDILYISVGRGGIGGQSGEPPNNDGQPGEISYISVVPSTGTPVAANVILASGTVGAGGGDGSTTLGTGGAGGTVFTTTKGILASLGLFNSFAGSPGADCTELAGNNITGLTTSILTGGASGGGIGNGLGVSGTSKSGGTIVRSGIVPTILGGLPNPNISTNAEDGYKGYISIRPNEMISQYTPFVSTGGSGGGGSNVSGIRSGNGGDGEIGSGGGGAGAGVDIAASGGRGGDGVVIITCF